MSHIRTRVVIERSLDVLPAIQEIIRNPGPDFQFSLSDRASMMSDGHADIMVIAAEADDDATLGRVWAICRSKHYPKVLLIAPGNAERLCEEAIVQGASGVIDDAASAALILKALTCMARGELWLDRQRTGRVFERLSRGMAKNLDCDGHVTEC